MFYLFFFSSRRRHTICALVTSSDVGSSDLNVDDGMLYVAGRDADCAVFDIAMRLVAADGGDPQRILLEPFGKRDDRLREGGRKQQRAPFRRGGVENLFPIVQIGRASGRERVWQYVSISVVAVYLKKKREMKNQTSIDL